MTGVAGGPPFSSSSSSSSFSSALFPPPPPPSVLGTLAQQIKSVEPLIYFFSYSDRGGGGSWEEGRKKGRWGLYSSSPCQFVFSCVGQETVSKAECDIHSHTWAGHFNTSYRCVAVWVWVGMGGWEGG